MLMRRRLVTLGLGVSLLGATSCGGVGTHHSEGPIGSTAGAKDTHIASVLGADVVLSIPKGYCALDKKNRVDQEPISTLEQVNAGRNVILLMFADCKQLEMFRTTGESLSNSGVYMAPRSARRPVKMSRAQFVAEFTAQLKQQKQLTDKGHDEGKRRVKEQNAGAEIERNVNLGVLHSDDTAVYTGVLQTWQVEGGGKEQVVTVGGLTVVRERVISVNLSAEYRGKDTVTGLLTAQRGIVRALIAAN